MSDTTRVYLIYVDGETVRIEDERKQSDSDFIFEGQLDALVQFLRADRVDYFARESEMAATAGEVIKAKAYLHKAIAALELEMLGTAEPDPNASPH
jgi:spore coat polysaccharide biosynthesis protein SpsF (cytidylyltransferase family)